MSDPAENRFREQICEAGARLFMRGQVAGSAGNISVRLADGGFLLTPTDACLGQLDPARLARLDAAGAHLSGDRPSKTIALHRQIYDAARAFDADTACVIHTHSTHCVALTLLPAASDAAELLPALTPYFVMKVGHVPCIPYHRPGDPRAAQRVAQTIGDWGARGVPIRAVMLERLGPNVWHRSLAEALACLEELEETARLQWIGPAGAAALSEAQIDELRTTFGARW